MEAIILVGGKGTRLRGVTKGLPKCMVDVAGLPFLARQVDWLKWSGIEHIILAVGDNYNTIEEYFGNGSRFGVSIDYSREYKELGTGGALKYATRLLKGNDFLCVHGDIAIFASLQDFIQEYYRSKAPALMYCSKLETSEKRFGRVSMRKDGTVTEFQEKGTGSSPFINTGVVAMSKYIIDFFDRGTSFFGLEELYNRLVYVGELRGYRSGTSFIDIGTSRDYALYCKVMEMTENGKR